MTSSTGIPVIDISAEGQDPVRVARELVDAATTHGFIYVKNTGKEIPAAAIDAAFDMSKKLFAEPLQEKEKCAIQQNNMGWSGMQVEILDAKNPTGGEFKESFNFGEFIDSKAQQPLPPAVAPYEAQIATFRDLCHATCLKITTLLGIGLEVDPPDFFTRAHQQSRGPSGSVFRVLYYPPLSATPDARLDDVRAGAHSDYGSITMLFRMRGQAGLEIQTPEGAWQPVPVTPPGTEHDPAPPVLVNIGDLLSYWTNGLLRSVVHRVVFPPKERMMHGEKDEEARYSMAFFCHPAGNTELTPVPSDRVRAHNAPKDVGRNPYDERTAMTADEHLQMRLRASYRSLYGKEEAVA